MKNKQLIDIVGHRGAKGLAPENTINSINVALENHVDAVEFDVRLTKDSHLVLCHDSNLEYTTGKRKRIKSLTLKQIQNLPTISGEIIPTLHQALQMLKSSFAIIELKDNGSINPLLKVLAKYPENKVRITSFKHHQLKELKTKRPDLFLYAAENTKPIEAIQNAALVKADGITLNFWLLNPLTYYLAKRHKLEIMVYTVNYRFVAWYIHVFYPGVSICTDIPNKIHKHGKF